MHPSRMHYRAVISGAADFIDYTVPDCFVRGTDRTSLIDKTGGLEVKPDSTAQLSATRRANDIAAQPSFSIGSTQKPTSMPVT